MKTSRDEVRWRGLNPVHVPASEGRPAFTGIVPSDIPVPRPGSIQAFTRPLVAKHMAQLADWAYRKEKDMNFNEKHEHVTIEWAHNKGWIVKVGCCTRVYTKMRDLLTDLEEYLGDPEKVAKEYGETVSAARPF